jgi:hypothetical protein
VDAEPACYLGAKGGAAYEGPFKSAAQRDMEGALLLHQADDFSALEPWRRACARALCHEEGTRRCSRCKSVRYCSLACQEADWPSHKAECTMYVPPIEWKYFSQELREYEKKFGHYPGESGLERDKRLRDVAAAKAGPPKTHFEPAGPEIDFNDFPVGSSVMIMRLQAKPEYNSKIGKVITFDAASGR